MISKILVQRFSIWYKFHEYPISGLGEDANGVGQTNKQPRSTRRAQTSVKAGSPFSIHSSSMVCVVLNRALPSYSPFHCA